MNMRRQDVYWLNELSILRYPLLGLSLVLLHAAPCQICSKANGNRVSARWIGFEKRRLFLNLTPTEDPEIAAFIPTSRRTEVPSNLRTSSALFLEACSRSRLRFEAMILVIYGNHDPEQRTLGGRCSKI